MKKLLIRIFNRVIKFKKRIFRIYYTYLVRRKCVQCGPNLKVNGRSYVTRQTTLGTNVNFNGMKIAGGGNVKIGDNFHSGVECLLMPQIHNYDKGTKIPYDSTYILKDITIGDNVWIGDRVIILGGVTIGEGVIIQAGSVVVKDIPKYAIAGGHPAQVFSQRDIEHYEKLKKEKKFH